MVVPKILVLLALAFATADAVNDSLFGGDGSTVHWFHEQRLDHYDLQNNRTFAQRFFVDDSSWKHPSGPVILQICGEYTCSGKILNRSFPFLLAERYGALVVTLEHRFFGKSQPFDDLNTKNFKYLTTAQALFDLASFTEWVQASITAKYGIEKNRWMTIGGSYPGALSAWYRLKFPHLTVGSLSSSGVVHAITEFYQFDAQVARAAGPLCSSALRGATAEIEALLPGIQTSFEAEHLLEDDFLMLIADAAGEAIQYGHRLELCNQMESALKNKESLAHQFANFTTEFFFKRMGASVKSYDSHLMSSPKYDPLGAGRQWWWMKCAEVGWFQVAPEQGSIRSERVDIEWHRRMCHRLFGENAPPFPPAVDVTNTLYGGDAIAATNIVFTNGIEDPWRWASIPRSLPSECSILIDCEQCGHCTDLKTPLDDDASSLKQARALIMRHADEWMDYLPSLPIVVA